MHVLIFYWHLWLIGAELNFSNSNLDILRIDIFHMYIEYILEISIWPPKTYARLQLKPFKGEQLRRILTLSFNKSTYTMTKEYFFHSHDAGYVTELNITEVFYDDTAFNRHSLICSYNAAEWRIDNDTANVPFIENYHCLIVPLC